MKEGDIVKIDLGCHIGGYFAHVGTTVVVQTDKTQKITGDSANLIVAGQTALQAGIRTIIAGNTNEDVTARIEKVAEEFKLNAMEGAYSHKHKKHLIDEGEVIMNKHMPERRAQKYEFAPGDVFGLDVYITTGDGKAKLSELRTTVFRRAVENVYDVRSKAGRHFLSEVDKRFPSLPFSIRSFSDDITTAKLGVKQCLEKELLEPFEVHTLNSGEQCARFCATVAIQGTGTAVLAGGDKHFDASKYEHSEKVADQELSDLLALSMDLKEQKKRMKAARKAAKKEESKD